MSVEVVTVWAPRPSHPKWRDDYVRLLDLQSKTCAKFGHKHTIVTDEKSWPGLPGHSTVLRSSLPEELMPAMIAGVVARLSYPTVSSDHLLFVDADVLICQNLTKAFADDFDLGLTWRLDVRSPVNNGCMYVNRRGLASALGFFERALARCQNHWGGDQEAISAEAAPVPMFDCIEQRDFGKLAFLPMNMYSCVPKTRGKRHTNNPFTVHFKGVAKEWATEYAEKFVLA